jgi:disulfide bond formation protein DsbB
MAIGMALIGTGCGFAMSPSTADALARARGHQRGEVSGIVQTFRLCGGALGVALFALVLQTTAPATPTPARDASSMPADLSPSGVAMGFALHAFVALAVLALAAACVRSRADTQDGSTATT